MVTEQELINEWKNKYIANPSKANIKFAYRELAIKNGFRMGYAKCRIYKNDKFGLKLIDAIICLDDDCMNCPTIFKEAVLWHEFCHVWDATDELHVDHCWNFQVKKWRKPKYALADCVLKLIGWVWFD